MSLKSVKKTSQIAGKIQSFLTCAFLDVTILKVRVGVIPTAASCQTGLFIYSEPSTFPAVICKTAAAWKTKATTHRVLSLRHTQKVRYINRRTLMLNTAWESVIICVRITTKTNLC